MVFSKKVTTPFKTQVRKAQEIIQGDKALEDRIREQLIELQQIN